MPITDYDGQLQTIARNLGEEPALTTTDGLLEAIAKGTENVITEDKLDDYAPLDSPALTGTPTAPTPDADDDSTKIATTAYVQAELEDYATLTDMAGYLPLSGGTMTGSVVSSVGNNVPCMSMSTDDKTCLLCGGSVASNGARIGLNGKDTSVDSGAFTITATDGTTKQLKGYPNGELTWNNFSITQQAYNVQMDSRGDGATYTFHMQTNFAIVFAMRGNNASIYMVDTWSNPIRMSLNGTDPITVTKETGNNITITNVNGNAVVLKILNGGSL